MRIEEMKQVIKQCNETIQEATKLLDTHTAARDEIDREIDAYIRSNSAAKERRALELDCDIREKQGKNSVIWTIVLEAVLFFVVLIARNALRSAFGDAFWIVRMVIHLLPLLILIFAIKHYSAAKQLRERIDKLSDELVDFDVVLRPMKERSADENRLVWKYTSEINAAKEKIKDYEEMIRFEKKYSQYSVNYALVFVGEKESSSKPYKGVRNLIEIDGMDYGFCELPFKPIYLTPGVHTLKITVQDYFGDRNHYYSSNVIQFDVSKESIYFECAYMGPTRGVQIIQHRSPRDFFASTKLEQK